MKYIVIFLLGGTLYSALEVLWRGYTHWTMTLCGGACFLLIYLLNRSLPGAGFLMRCLAGTAVITSAELLVGITVNIVLGWGVWDYSHMPFNFMGQICLPYTVLWFLLCIPVFGICKFIDKII